MVELVGKQIYCIGFVNQWERLSHGMVWSPSVKVFNHRLDHHLSKMFHSSFTDLEVGLLIFTSILFICSTDLCIIQSQVI